MIDAANRELPFPRINIAVDRHASADLEIIIFRKPRSDNAAAAISLECLLLFRTHHKLWVNLEKIIRIDGEAREKLILIFVDSAKPRFMSNVLYSRNLL